VASAGELIAYAAPNPGKLTYGSAAQAAPRTSPPNTSKLATGTTSCMCPTRGVGPMLTDLISGQLSWGSTARRGLRAARESGPARARAGDGLTRLPSRRQIPTLDDRGVKGFHASGWYGILAPAGTGARDRDEAEPPRSAAIMQTPESYAPGQRGRRSPRPARPRHSRRSSSPRSARWRRRRGGSARG